MALGIVLMCQKCPMFLASNCIRRLYSYSCETVVLNPVSYHISRDLSKSCYLNLTKKA